jgi:hypothetical protein
MVAYYNGSAGKVNYAVWSATASVNPWVIAPTQLTMASLTGQIYWVKLKPRLNANTIALAVLDANSDISAAIWNGSGWLDNVNLTTSGSIATKEAFDIAWESISGDLLSIWGTGTTTNYRKWYSTSTWAGTLSGPNISNTGNWIRLCSSPLSNKIGFTSIGGSSYWHTAIWRPSDVEGWSSLPTYDSSMSANDKRITDCAWQSKTEQFIAIAVDDIGTYDNQFDWITWNNGTWTPASPSVTTANTNTTFSTDIKWTNLLNDPDSNNVMAWAVDTSNNLRSTAWSGTSWSPSGSGVNFYHGVIQDYNYESFAIEFKRKDNIPPTITNNQSGDSVWRNSNYAAYSVFANDSGGSLLKSIQTKIYTQSNGGGSLIENWADQVSDINSGSYSSAWKLSDNSFNLLQNGTNYIWVRAIDNAGNISNEWMDAFYVKKDTIAPSITNNMPSDFSNVWTSTGVGAINIDFSDSGGSKISSAAYSIWTGPNQSGVNVASNVPIFSNLDSNVYDNDWNINFSLLANTTNYITVTVWDSANSSTTLIDSFKVLKDTISPNAISNLSATAGPTIGTVLLSFSSPGDDNTLGDNLQGGYVIKYATFNITNDTLFNSATTYNEYFKPKSVGQSENIVLYNLATDTTYYFAVKSYDKANNLSAISNSAYALAQKANVFINEVYPSGSSGYDWIELYNNTSQNFSLEGWKLIYHQGALGVESAEVDLWSGSSSDSISSGSFKAINISLDLNSSQSYSIILKNSEGKVIDSLQWPIISSGRSFARVYDGSPYFEIDPTPTPGYANSIATSPVKINEVSYKNWEFIELYNSTNEYISLNNYSLRNSNGVLFRFTRKISTYSYTLLDSSSFSNDGYSWSYSFNSGLNENGDFIALENNSGQTLDRVSWKGTISTLYNYKAELVSNASYAPANSNTSIIRTNGADTDNDSLDFTASSLITPLSRNSNYGQAGSNDLFYPVESGYMPYNFPIKIRLNSDFSGGYSDLIAFINIDGTDTKSPHIYKIDDIGFNLSDTSIQTRNYSLDNFVDIDGNKLKDKASYKVIFNCDNASASSNNVYLSSVTVDASSITVNASLTQSNWLNPLMDIDIFKIVIQNPSNYDVYLTSITLSFDTTSQISLTTQQLKDLLQYIRIYRDSAQGLIGVFESGIDNDLLSSIENNAFVLDNGKLAINISTDSLSFIASKSTSTYFVVFVSSINSYNSNPNSFISNIDLGYLYVADSINMLYQNKIMNPSSIYTSTISVIHPGADDVWYYDTHIVSNLKTMSAVDYLNYNHLYIGADDGIMRSIDYGNGGEKWSFATNPAAKIITSPIVSYGSSNETFIYFACENGDIYKVQDNGSGVSQVWKTNINAQVSGELYDSDDKIYFGTKDNKIYCLNKANATTCSNWTFDTGINSPITSSLSIDFRQDVNVGWTGLYNGNIISFRLTDGVLLNQFITNGPVYSAPFIDSAYSSASNNLFIASTDGKLYSRTAANLSVKPANWNDVTLNAATYSSPYKVLTSTIVLIGDESGRLYKIDSINGTILKTFDTNSPIRILPLEYDGYVYFASGKYIYSLNLNTFELKTGYPIYVGSEVEGGLVIDVDTGYLTFSTNAGKTFMIDLW